jgi:hypothetical protein
MRSPKPIANVGEDFLARIDAAFERAAAAPDADSLELATRQIAALGRGLAEELALLAPALRRSAFGTERRAQIERLRRMVGGRDAG